MPYGGTFRTSDTSSSMPSRVRNPKLQPSGPQSIRGHDLSGKSFPTPTHARVDALSELAPFQNGSSPTFI